MCIIIIKEEVKNMLLTIILSIIIGIICSAICTRWFINNINELIGNAHGENNQINFVMPAFSLLLIVFDMLFVMIYAKSAEFIGAGLAFLCLFGSVAIGIALGITTKALFKNTKKEEKKTLQSDLNKIKNAITILDDKIIKAYDDIDRLATMQKTTTTIDAKNEIVRTIAYLQNVASKYSSMRDQLLSKQFQIETQIDLNEIQVIGYDMDRNLRKVNKKQQALSNVNMTFEDEIDNIMKKYQ